jgi:hypothetical protein
MGQLALNIQRHHSYNLANLFYLLTIPAVLFVFYGENIKNGVFYSSVLITLFVGVLLFSNFRQYWVPKLLVFSFVLGIGIIVVGGSIKANDSWRTFVADSKVARDTQTYQHWKYNASQGYPNNELGTMVSVTNYERMAWGKEGIKMMFQNPLGYGLIERSFGHLAKIKWPDSLLHQSHSGWIDLGLGVGIPGILLILSCLLLLLYSLLKQGKYHDAATDERPSLYLTMAWWALVSLLIMWCTTEISQKVYFDDLIFWLALGAGLILGLGSKADVLKKASQPKG